MESLTGIRGAEAADVVGAVAGAEADDEDADGVGAAVVEEGAAADGGGVNRGVVVTAAEKASKASKKVSNHRCLKLVVKVLPGVILREHRIVAGHQDRNGKHCTIDPESLQVVVIESSYLHACGCW